MNQFAALIQEIDRLRTEIEALRPIDREQEARVLQKFWLDWNYHSNAIEGNTLTYGETRAFLLHGITAQGKPFRDYLDMKGHKDAIEYLEELVRQQSPLTEVAIREMHRILLVEPYEMPALTADGYPTTRRIAVGQYKTAPNSVRTSTGRMHFYATSEETPALMGDLIKWYREQMEKKSVHPLMVATLFHHRFVSIHPFDDGNGRMARLLMNLILMQNGFVPVIIPTDTKSNYILALEQADQGNIEQFAEYIGQRLVHSLDLFLRAAKGERVDTLTDLDKQVALLQKRLVSEGKSDYSPKTTASHLALFQNLLKPFLSGLLSRLTKLEMMFAGHDLHITYEVPGPRQVELRGDYLSLLQQLENVLNLDFSVYRIIVTSWLIGFLEAPNASIKLNIRFELNSYQVLGIYEVNPAQFRIAEVRNEFIQAGYFKEYDRDEIDQLIYPIFEQILNRIQKLAEPPELATAQKETT